MHLIGEALLLSMHGAGAKLSTAVAAGCRQIGNGLSGGRGGRFAVSLFARQVNRIRGR